MNTTYYNCHCGQRSTPIVSPTGIQMLLYPRSLVGVSSRPVLVNLHVHEITLRVGRREYKRKDRPSLGGTVPSAAWSEGLRSLLSTCNVVIEGVVTHDGRGGRDIIYGTMYADTFLPSGPHYEEVKSMALQLERLRV